MCLVQKGFPSNKTDLDEKYSNFWNYRNSLHVHDQVIMFQDRVVVPPSLRHEILDSLHAAHGGPAAMISIAQSTVFWPGISHDIERERQTCRPCNKNAPSQPRLEPVPPIFPTTPFEAIVSDYFEFNGMNYLVIADRLSAWTESYRTKAGTEESGSRGLILLLKRFFGTFGVPRELSSDGGPEFMANATQDFLVRWGVQFRLSAAYNPQSNGRAELAVKSTKRLIEDNIGEDGELNTDRFLRAILIKRNTPDPTSKLSPAEIVFGRKLRDTMPRIDKSINIFNNKTVRPTWTEAWEQKELALRTRYQGCEKRLGEHCKTLPGLNEGDRVSVQNQTGNKPAKWDRTGTVVEVRDYDKYIVKIDGSGRLTLRNRRFLKKMFDDRGLYGSTQYPVNKPMMHPETKPKVPDDQKTQSPTNLKARFSTPSPQSVLPTRSHSLPRSPPSPIQSPEQPSEQTTPNVRFSIPAKSPVTPTIRNTSPPESSTSVSRADGPRKTLFSDIVQRTPRPTRNKSERLFYDASKGEYVARNPGKEVEGLV
jgi:hypothetical protein